MDYTLQKIFAVLIFVLTIPIFILVWVAERIENKGPALFIQKRMGKNRKPFVLYKFRTMVVGAEKLKKKYKHLNESNGPTFKIWNDPRHTKVGRVLSHTGLDELPQLINIIKGEMAFVGPRPLPLDEARKVPKRYQKRFSVLPGITSPWVVKGSHNLSFKKWMELDLDYVKKRSFFLDIKVGLLTFVIIMRSIFFGIKSALLLKK